jgi:DNA-binding MarR family transcriptional regulator
MNVWCSRSCLVRTLQRWADGVPCTLSIAERTRLSHEEQILTTEGIRDLLYRRDVAMAGHRASVARTLGVTDIEMLVLVHLAERTELPPSQIAALLDLSSGGATALVQRLERAGHVTRAAHPTDRRSILIRLSERTAARLEKEQAPLVAGLESTARALSEIELAAVEKVLTAIASLSEELDASLRHEADTEPDAFTRPVPSLWA